MSAIITCTTQLKNKKDLVSALKLMGVPEKHLQVAEYGGTVGHSGYGRQKRRVEVNIAKAWHRGYGDIGFNKQKDGTYELIMDDLDGGKMAKEAGGEFPIRIQQFYTAAVSVRTLTEQGYSPKVTQDKEMIRVRAIAY